MAQPSVPDLSGRVVVVTGGARGMGAAYVRAFLADGARVVAADRVWAGAESLKQELSDAGALAVTMDVTDDGQVDQAYRETLERFGTVDALINNAAMRQRDLFPPSGWATTLGTSDGDFLRMYNVNVFGALKVTRRFIQPMIEQGRGSVVNIASSGIIVRHDGDSYAAFRPDSREQPYMSSKAALANLTFYLAAEVQEHNVAVNVVIPGHTRTTGSDEQARARMKLTGRPARDPVKPEHTVPLVRFLIGQDAGGVTGRMFDALQWNAEHGFGGYDEWRVAPMSPDASA
jgi:NAD(P)-dependent dehydrogenase (short-subunit alcohol dehydrogenase family)